jgi:hypothetical protein
MKTMNGVGVLECLLDTTSQLRTRHAGWLADVPDVWSLESLRAGPICQCVCVCVCVCVSVCLSVCVGVGVGVGVCVCRYACPPPSFLLRSSPPFAPPSRFDVCAQLQRWGSGNRGFGDCARIKYLRSLVRMVGCLAKKRVGGVLKSASKGHGYGSINDSARPFSRMVGRDDDGLSPSG